MYSSVQALRDRLGKKFDAIYNVRDDLAEADLVEVSAVIDGYLAATHQTPVYAGPLVCKWALDLAVEKAHGRTESPTLPAKVVKDADNVRKALADAAKGIIRLPADPDAETPAAPDQPGPAVFFANEEPVFGRVNMDGY